VSPLDVPVMPIDPRRFDSTCTSIVIGSAVGLRKISSRRTKYPLRGT
jgi:hypothetical protein